jgi:hypothetical protein
MRTEILCNNLTASYWSGEWTESKNEKNLPFPSLFYFTAVRIVQP